MLRAPIWITSATSSTGSRSRASMTSVTIGRPVCGLGLGQQPQALLAQALEGVGRGARLVGAAAEHRGPGGRHRVGGVQRLLARLDGARAGDHREVVAADPAPGDVQHAARAVGDLAGGQLVGLGDRDHVVDPGRALELEPGDVLARRRSPRSRSARRRRSRGRARPRRALARRRPGPPPRWPPVSSRSSSACQSFQRAGNSKEGRGPGPRCGRVSAGVRRRPASGFSALMARAGGCGRAPS